MGSRPASADATMAEGSVDPRPKKFRPGVLTLTLVGLAGPPRARAMPRRRRLTGSGTARSSAPTACPAKRISMRISSNACGSASRFLANSSCVKIPRRAGPMYTPLARFDGNVAHSTKRHGLKLSDYFPAVDGASCGTNTFGSPATFSDFVGTPRRVLSGL